MPRALPRRIENYCPANRVDVPSRRLVPNLGDGQRIFTDSNPALCRGAGGAPDGHQFPGLTSRSIDSEGDWVGGIAVVLTVRHDPKSVYCSAARCRGRFLRPLGLRDYRHSQEKNYQSNAHLHVGVLHPPVVARKGLFAVQNRTGAFSAGRALQAASIRLSRLLMMPGMI